MPVSGAQRAARAWEASRPESLPVANKRNLPAGGLLLFVSTLHEGMARLMRMDAGVERDMRDLDSALHQLSQQPVHPNLDVLEAKVLEHIKRHSFSEAPLGVRAAAIGFALLIGVAGGMLPDAEARAKRAGPALSEALELAPSTLLGGAP